jgi:hypothetical protein
MSMGSGFGSSPQQSIISPLHVPEEEALCERSSGISESLRLQIWAVHGQMTHDKKKGRNLEVSALSWLVARINFSPA